MNTIQRWCRKVTLPIEPEGCWEWQGTSSLGYGRFWFSGTMGHAHRYAYQAFVGAIPQGLQIDHVCRNRLCVNPAHLEAVTQQENILRGSGTSAAHAQKTHCFQGHPLTGSNLRIGPSKHDRICRECSRQRKRRWLASRSLPGAPEGGQG